MKTVRLSVLAVAALALSVSGGRAQGTQAQAAGGWKFEVTPYAWIAGMEGDATIHGQKAEFEKSFSDLLDYVELGASIRLGASYDRYMIGALVDYFSLSTDALDVEDRPQGGSIDADTMLLEGAVGYRLDGWAEGQSFGVMVGVRSLQIDSKLKVNDHGTFENDTDVTDGMFYLVPSMPVLPSKLDGLRFNPVLGIGAGDSDLAYEMFPQFQYQITETMAARFGYRTVGWKFEEGDNELNVSMSGLIVGLGIVL